MSSEQRKPLILPLFASSIASDRNWFRLDQLADVIDCPHSTPELIDDPNAPLVVRSQDMRSGTFMTALAGRVSEETYKERISRAEPQFGDLLYSREGTYFGIAAEVPPGVRVCLGQRMVLIRPRGDKIDHRFLRHWLNSPQIFGHIHGFRDGTVAERLNLPTIRGLAVALPALRVQQKVGEILGALDDRITLLRETNATLEAIAQALFKSWFVDFDPVRAKAEGRARQDGERSGQPRMPQASDLPRPGAEAGAEAQGQPEGAIQGSMSAAEGRMPKAAMDAATAALFPDSFEESELGLVPKGWAIGCVGDLASQKKGSVNPFASPEVLFEHYSLPAFDSGQTPVIELGQEIKSNKTPLPEEAVLLSKLNPHIPRVWLPVLYGPNAVCSTEFLAYSPQEGASKEFIYCLFSSESFQLQLCQLVTGTSNSHQRVKPDQVLAVKLPIADRFVLKAFAELAKPLLERVHANRQQAQTLTQLRDTLLPRLISGQLRLPEAEATVEEVL